jgi:hypothetical protein
MVSRETAMTTTTTHLKVEHPYRGLGLFLVIVSLILVAFDVGVLARCGGGEGVCFDDTTHATSDAALVAFFVLFVLGLMLVVYSAGEVVSTMRTNPTPPPATPPVAVVTVPQSPPPATTNVTVNPAPVTPTPSQTNVNVNPSTKESFRPA